MEQVGGLLILEPFGLGKVGERQLYSSSPRSLSCGYNGVSLVGCYLGIPIGRYAPLSFRQISFTRRA